MATILNTQILSESVGENQTQVTLIFTFDNGEIVRECPRHFIGVIDLQAIASQIGTLLLDTLKGLELYACIFIKPWDYVLKYATNAELAAYVREMYLYSNKDTLAIVAARILEWIANGRYTDVQIRNVFNLSAAQWTTLKTKMQNLVNNYTAVESATGE